MPIASGLLVGGDCAGPVSLGIDPPNISGTASPTAFITFDWIPSTMASFCVYSYIPPPTTVRDTTLDAIASTLIIFCMMFICQGRF